MTKTFYKHLTQIASVLGNRSIRIKERLCHYNCVLSPSCTLTPYQAGAEVNLGSYYIICSCKSRFKSNSKKRFICIKPVVYCVKKVIKQGRTYKSSIQSFSTDIAPSSIQKCLICDTHTVRYNVSIADVSIIPQW